MSQIGSIGGLQLNLAGTQGSAERSGGNVQFFASQLPPQISVGETLVATVLRSTATEILVDLKGRQISLAGGQRYPPGTELLLRVVSLDPAILEVLQGQRDTLPSAQLQPGQTVQARVLDQLPGGRVLLDIQGNLYQAEGEPIAQAKIGSQFSLVVDRTEPQLVLQITGRDSPIRATVFSLIRSNLVDHTQSGQALDDLLGATSQAGPESSTAGRVQAFLRNLLQPGRLPTAETLAALARDGGLHFEAKLAQAAAAGDISAFREVANQDLKGLLLRLQAELGHQGITEGQMPEAVERNLAHIESRQAANVLAQLQGQALLLNVPLFVGPTPQTALLAIDVEDHFAGAGEDDKPSNRRGYNVLFLLHLEDFGDVRIDAFVADGSLRVNFFVERSESVAAIQHHLPELQAALHGVGFQEVLLRAQLASEMTPSLQTRVTALSAGIPTNESLVDVRV
ncbi:MAG: hypothetical protein KatS3mg105_0758 [Gemmatales bacterium]|nr:MAG: hypothetical protein KatS3mg105_0758 [Gemmatales bacterium]